MFKGRFGVRARFQSPCWRIFAVFIIGFLLTAAYFCKEWNKELNKLETQFERDAAIRANLIADKLNHCLLVVEALQSSLYGSNRLDRAGFKIFTTPFLAERKELQVLEWLPRVLQSERADFEGRERQDVAPGFQIKDLAPDGRLISAGDRDEYYPVQYIEPVKGNELIIGFNMASEPIRRAALEQARDTGKAAVTERIRLIQGDKEFCFIICFPIYREGMPTSTVDQRRAALEGFSIGIFRIGDALASAINIVTPQGIPFDLFDRSAPPERQFLFHWTGRIQAKPTWTSFLLPPAPRYVRIFNFGGRRWEINITANSAYMEQCYSLSYWLIPPAGLAITLFLGLYLRTIMSQGARMERTVRERTAELRKYKENLEGLVQQRAGELKQVNETLKKEAAERKQAENLLQKSEDRLRLILDSTAEAIYGIDLAGNCMFCNPACIQSLGYENADQLLGKNMHWLIHHSRQDGTPYPIEECRIVQVFQKGAGSHVDDEVLWRADGTSFSAECWSYPQRIGDKIVGAVVAFVDITDRKHAQEALQMSEERLRAIYECSSDAIMLATEQGYMDCNPAALEMFGYETKEEFISLHLADVSPPTQPDGKESLKAAQERMQTAFQKGVNHFEWVHRCKNGEDFPAEVLLSAFDYGGKRVLQATVRDITQRKRAEIELKKLSVAVEQSPAIIVITDPEGNIEYANPKFSQTTGYTLYEARGKNPRILKSGKTTQEEYQVLWDTIRSGREWRGEFYNKKKSGDYYWEQALIAPIKNDNGVITNFIAIKEDITERKRAEEALRESETKYRTLVENLPQKVFLKDENSIYVSCNKHYAQDLKIQPDEITGKTDYDFYPGELAEKYRADDKRIMETGETEDIEEKYVLNGQEFWVNTVKVPVRNERSNIVGVLGIFRDITKYKWAEKALKMAHDDLANTNLELKKADEVKNRFLAGMSHEIRTPLNAIIGMTGLLLDTKLDAEQRDCAETVRVSGEMLLTLINDILDFSKIEAEKMELEEQPFDLCRCMEESLDLVKQKAEEKKLVIGYVIKEGMPSCFTGDVTRLRQILVNLLSNAVKFTDKGEVTLSAAGKTLDNGRYQLHFTVRDTGIGIPPDHQDRLFQSFSQVDASTSRRFGGTGLGLAISKRLCEMMGGTMWVEMPACPAKARRSTSPFRPRRLPSRWSRTPSILPTWRGKKF